MAGVRGSWFRRTLFWLHLSAGVLAGVFILMMSATGVLLAYEHQIVEHYATSQKAEGPAGAAVLTADQIAERARALAPAARNLSLAFRSDERLPVAATAGRDGSWLLNPYDGSEMADAAAGARGFLGAIERWHRWVGGDARSTRANLNDIANLLFVFITVSGLYLWLPALWRWRTVREQLRLRLRNPSSRMRDYNWHHALGIWALIPLFLIALSGVVISYGWASNLVYAAYGEKAPQRGGPGGPPGGGAGGPAQSAPVASATLQALLDASRQAAPGWHRITLPANPSGARTNVTVEVSSAPGPVARRTLVLDTATAQVVEPLTNPAAAQSPGQRARVWFRFVHTGEQYGVIGQTIAALASLAACFLAYTGVALAWRRLVPKRRTKPA